ncbi:MAG: hypothetical protein JW987_08175 [Anaerolineaceae bacterium]|nr:hypothetical protein [Anaerolineaceae bacterium]
MLRNKPVPWWAILPVIGILIPVVLLLYWKKRPRERFLIFTPAIRVPEEPKPAAQPAAVQSVDDLTVIKGIGPKTQAALNAAGICSLSQLATASVEQLRTILQEAGLRLGDPADWPAQAAFLVKNG